MKMSWREMKDKSLSGRLSLLERNRRRNHKPVYYPRPGIMLSCYSNHDFDGELATMMLTENNEYQTFVIADIIQKRSDFKDFDFLSNGEIFRVREGKIEEINGLTDDIPTDKPITTGVI